MLISKSTQSPGSITRTITCDFSDPLASSREAEEQSAAALKQQEKAYWDAVEKEGVFAFVKGEVEAYIQAQAQVRNEGVGLGIQGVELDDFRRPLSRGWGRRSSSPDWEEAEIEIERNRDAEIQMLQAETRNLEAALKEQTRKHEELSQKQNKKAKIWLKKVPKTKQRAAEKKDNEKGASGSTKTRNDVGKSGTGKVGPAATKKPTSSLKPKKRPVKVKIGGSKQPTTKTVVPSLKMKRAAEKKKEPTPPVITTVAYDIETSLADIDDESEGGIATRVKRRRRGERWAII